MNDHLTLLVAIENDVVAHKVLDSDNNTIVETGICTHIGHLCSKISAKFGEINFRIYQDGELCKPSKPSLFHCITNPQ
jgi:hypothetical protein